MKAKLIIFLIFITLAGCGASSGIVRDSHLGNDLKPLMQKTPQEEKIHLEVPVYKF